MRDKKEEDTLLLFVLRLPLLLLLSGSAKRLKARYEGKKKRQESARGRADQLHR